MQAACVVGVTSSRTPQFVFFILAQYWLVKIAFTEHGDNDNSLVISHPNPSVEERFDIDCPVVFSYLLYGPVKRMKTILENALQYTENGTLIVAHLNQIEKLSSNDSDWRWLRERNASMYSRVFINPVSISIRRMHGSIQAGHLLNFEYAKKIAPNFTHFTQMASDQLFFRGGVEAWIRKQNFSFSLGHTKQSVGLGSRVSPGLVDFAVDDVGKLATTYIETLGAWETRTWAGPCYNNFIAFCKRINKSLPVPNFYRHEGSFYPRQIMEGFYRYLGTPGRKSLAVSRGNLEEFLLPSYVLNIHKQDVLGANFAPPIVAISGNGGFEPATTTALIKKHLENGSHSKDDVLIQSSFYAIKFMYPYQMEADVLDLALRMCSTDGCACNIDKLRGLQAEEAIHVIESQTQFCKGG
mmetsp:Transcript_15010/g.28560  ORF Transcript_15010/g.28560 Transcript_15010/m.28560 type:complete len:411 (-) Transcript_15010:202-1434(-)|eukprot:CAMPEP_0170180906 /NCGR_PEP_ID=MMETSP0040_2-20121228/23352_1 /TAXON_ID=641309 /ORGANISM="Lotharella oceanica, Strain CCMP622" /LENGTH=410 /DNA_ID=CAMNT_0010425707 /DNA_START=101 /DNA_END=1333 /DNA_ORIENTATION=-